MVSPPAGPTPVLFRYSSRSDTHRESRGARLLCAKSGRVSSASRRGVGSQPHRTAPPGFTALSLRSSTASCLAWCHPRLSAGRAEGAGHRALTISSAVAKSASDGWISGTLRRAPVNHALSKRTQAACPLVPCAS